MKVGIKANAILQDIWGSGDKVISIRHDCIIVDAKKADIATFH